MSTVEDIRNSADERAWATFRRAVASEVAGKPLHRSGTAYVRADLPELGQVLRRYEGAGRAVVLVYEDGTERVIDGREDRVRQILRLAAIALFSALIWDALKKGRVGAS